MPVPYNNGPYNLQGPTAIGPYNIAQTYQQQLMQQPGYNPQQTYLPQPTQNQPTQPQLVGRVVTANDMIPPAEIPSNGTPAYFPMQDGSAILVKVWDGNGNINTVRYVPEPTQPAPQPQPQDKSAQEEILKRLDSLESKITSLTDSLTN